MIHLDYLEGGGFKGIDYVIKKAIADIEATEGGGLDGIILENWKEESLNEFVSPETAKNFLQVTKALASKIHVPFGINVLNNDYKLAFLAAKQTHAAFVQLDVFVDKVQSDFEYNANAVKKPFVIDPKPSEIWQYAHSIHAEKIPLFVFVQPKHYQMIDDHKTIEESTQQAIDNGASGILVTKATGFAPTIDLIKKVKKAAGNTPVGIGSGFSTENAREFLDVVDFAVVGTSIKFDNKTDNPVDVEKVKALMQVVKKPRVNANTSPL